MGISVIGVSVICEYGCVVAVVDSVYFSISFLLIALSKSLGKHNINVLFYYYILICIYETFIHTKQNIMEVSRNKIWNYL